MVLTILIILLTVLSVVIYKIFNKEICCPAFLFTVPFIIACIVAKLFEKEWHFSIHLNTFFVIFGGCIFFLIGTLTMKRVRIKKLSNKKSAALLGVNGREIEFWKYYLFIFAEIMCYAWKLRFILAYGRSNGAGDTLSGAISYVNNTSKFTTQSLIAYPSILSLGLRICTAAGFVWACILAQKILQKNGKRKHLILTFINFLICIVGSMTSGGRGGAVQLIIAFLAAYLILYSRANNWQAKIPFKIILRVAIVVLITGYGFVAVMDLIGRSEINLIGKYLSTYCGAEIHNLDYFLNVSYRNSEIFGQETFQPIIQYFSGKLGISEWSRYNLDIPSIYVHSVTWGYMSLGNVCTTFYSYIHDFGYLGAIILPFIMGAISQLAYSSAKNSNINRDQNLGLIIYSNIAYCLVFSFFSNKFYEIIFSPDMVKKIICMWLMLLFLYKVRFCAKYKTRVQTKTII